MPPDDAVYEHLHSLMHALKGELRQAAIAATDDLPPMAARALAFFSRHPGSTPTDLVAHSGRDKAQIARLVRLLESERYVSRVPDPRDGRSHSLTLTARGRALYKKVQAHHKRVVRRLMSGLTQAEAETLGALLSRLRANLTETRGGRTD